MSDGTVRCWGRNTVGQLGDGTTGDHPIPATVSSLGGTATSIAAGQQHTCAMLSDGAVRCWGFNIDGQLGDGTMTNRLTPVAVINMLGTATSISTIYRHTCVLLNHGTVSCWGLNANGQLGDASLTDRTTPTIVINVP